MVDWCVSISSIIVVVTHKMYLSSSNCGKHVQCCPIKLGKKLLWTPNVIIGPKAPILEWELKRYHVTEGLDVCESLLLSSCKLCGLNVLDLASHTVQSATTPVHWVRRVAVPHEAGDPALGWHVTDLQAPACKHQNNCQQQ